MGVRVEDYERDIRPRNLRAGIVAGLIFVAVLFGLPWYLMAQGKAQARASMASIVTAMRSGNYDDLEKRGLATRQVVVFLQDLNKREGRVTEFQVESVVGQITGIPMEITARVRRGALREHLVLTFSRTCCISAGEQDDSQTSAGWRTSSGTVSQP
jgi:hypothetical protein